MSTAKSGSLKLMCRKTTPCRFYHRGACKRGSACNFAHGQDDMRTKPDLQRTKLCPAVASGQRCEGTSCPFAHDAEAIRKFRPKVQASDLGAASPSRKSSGQVFQGDFSSNCSTTSGGSSCGQANSDACTDCVGSLSLHPDGCQGSIELSQDGIVDADASWSRQTTKCSDASFGRQVSSGGLSRQTSPHFESDRSPGHRKHKTRLCAFFLQGKCLRSECTFAHGAHELSSRAGRKEAACGSGVRRPGQAPPASTTRGAPRTPGPPIGQAPPSPPQSRAPRPGSPPAESTAGCGRDSPLPPPSSAGGSWAPLAEPGPPCADEEACELVVVNTFLSLVVRGAAPKELPRSSSAPPGR